MKGYFEEVRSLGRKESGKIPVGGSIWAISLRREGIWSCLDGDKWQVASFPGKRCPGRNKQVLWSRWITRAKEQREIRVSAKLQTVLNARLRSSVWDKCSAKACLERFFREVREKAVGCLSSINPSICLSSIGTNSVPSPLPGALYTISH